MMTAKGYRILAAHYSRSAEKARDSYSRYQLRMLANNYRTRAKSTQVLNRSARVLEALEQRRNKAASVGGTFNAREPKPWSRSWTSNMGGVEQFLVPSRLSGSLDYSPA
jgi:hypothetical protein